MIYLLNAIGLTPGDGSTVHIYAQTINRTTQLTTLVGRLVKIKLTMSSLSFKLSKAAELLEILI